MRAVIFAGGRIDDYDAIKKMLLPKDYIIAADSGYDHLFKMGISPDIVIGDFDSVKAKNIKEPFLKLNPVKNETDTEAAISLAIQNEAEEIVIFAGIGSRFDHSLSNAFLLKNLYSKNIRAKIVDERNEIFYFCDEIELLGSEGDIISIIPITDLRGVTTEGLFYSLENDTLKSGFSRGVSNVFTDTVCKINAVSGEAFVIKSKD